MPRHQFTAHAVERISERCQTPVPEILTRMDKGHSITTGQEVSSHRVHDLLYLPADEQWFVLVKDTRSREIITFLPFDYHENCGWIISQEAMDMAKNSAANYNEPPTQPQIDAAPNTRPFGICILYKRGGPWTKTANLGQHQLSPTEPLSHYQTNLPLRTRLRSRIIQMKIPLHSITALLLRPIDNSPHTTIYPDDLRLEPLA